MRNHIGLILLVAAAAGWPEIVKSQTKSTEGDSTGHKSKIVFVCEHGAALSVVSAAYFNKIAREEHLNLYAIARGTTPQKDVAVSARHGLKADGIPFETTRPQALSSRDVAQARRIVAFCPIPPKYARMLPVETWNDVPPTAVNYGLARDIILKHLQELIRQLKSDDQKP